jgi:predicted transcriptional regulator
MESYLNEALELVKAQAGVRAMTADEIGAMLRALSSSIRAVMSMATETGQGRQEHFGKNSIKEQSIHCLECGKICKQLTKKHLLSHGLTPDEYREKYGLEKGEPLMCKELRRTRRKKMKSMKLWERRKKIPTGQSPNKGGRPRRRILVQS